MYKMIKEHITLIIAIVLFIFFIKVNKENFSSITDKCKKTEDCSYDKYCKLSSKVCVKKIELNNTCDDTIQCNYGYCNKSSNRCTTIDKGGNCKQDLDCSSGICDGSLHCL